MTLPTGTISMSQVNTELGYSSNATISLNQTAVRTLAGVPSGTISMNNLRGKSNAFAFTISSNQTNANLRTLAVAAGWDQTKKVAATINSGVYISSNSTGTPALTVTGSFPNGVELINNGLIIGMGGSGGGQTIVGFGPGVDGNAGGAALSTSVALSVNNAGTIGGGGGGGGASGATYNFDVENQQGWLQGGGGGGRSSAAANSAGGASPYGTGNGSQGTVSAAGAGGLAPAYVYGSYGTRGVGGTGGNWGSTGSSGTMTGPWPGGVGGASGASVSGNSNITWIATGTRLGPIT